MTTLRTLLRGAAFAVSLFFITGVGPIELPQVPAPPASGPCVDGSTCHCDTVSDPNLLACEDFEAPTLGKDVNAGGGSPNYGPWYDDSGLTEARGFNAYWPQNYGSAVGTCAWRFGEPASPSKGNTCRFNTCFLQEWSPGDPWNGNDGACVDIIKAGEFDAEVSTLADPVIPGGGSGVFAGSHSMGYRIAPRETGGILGALNLGASYTDIGITMALGYASNVGTAGVWAEPWKHAEWGTNPWIEFWHLGNTGLNRPQSLPYSPFMFHTSESGCNTSLAGATVSVGDADCTDIALRMGADTGVYDQATDFPWGSWACHQARITGMGTASMELRIWHNETLIFEMTGFDSSVLRNQSYKFMNWNAYSNANQTTTNPTVTCEDRGSCTTETTYRYEDNITITNGPPVSCSDIGFTLP